MKKILLTGCTLGLLLGAQAHANQAPLDGTLGKIAKGAEASASPTITDFTTQWAVMNSSTGFIIEASTGVVIQALRARSGSVTSPLRASGRDHCVASGPFSPDPSARHLTGAS